jgi:hypothetical protein
MVGLVCTQNYCLITIRESKGEGGRGGIGMNAKFSSKHS